MTMRTLRAVISKETMLLWRDRPGLLVLFVMPAVLVIVITLVQDNVMRLTGQQPSRLLVLDLDGGPVGVMLGRHLADAGLAVIEAEKPATPDAVRTAVVKGQFSAGLIIPEGTSRAMADQVDRLLRPPGADEAGAREINAIGLPLFFDPGIMASLRNGVNGRVEAALAAVARERLLAGLESTLAPLLSRSGSDPLRSSGSGWSEIFSQPILTAAAAGDETVPDYRPVQQNVPAWALFGMFFTAIPLAGGLLKERASGIWLRLRTLPVSLSLLYGGKVIAYLLVCCCQFLLIVVIGMVVFPAVGLPAFSIAANPGTVLLIVLLSGCAACSFGVLLGTVCRTYEQASTVGAVSVVVGAALGGVMVPVSAMPPLLQQVSVVSPLNWGLNAFHEIVVREGPLLAAGGDMIRLLFFAGGALALAVWRLRVQ